MNRISIVGITLGVLLLTGCAPQAASLAEMGCRSIDEYLPEFDSAEAGDMSAAELQSLNDRVVEELRLGYFDDETLGWFRLLADPLGDALGESFTPVDDYASWRGHAISYCQGDVGWVMNNA